MREHSIVRLVAKVSPWLAPVPSAYFVGRSAILHLGAPLPIAAVIGLVIELLGVSTAFTILDLRRWNRLGHVTKDDKPWEKAPERWAWFSAVTYLVSTFLLLFVLEAAPEASKFAPVLFPFIALSGAVLLAVVQQHDDRKARYGMSDSLRKVKDRKRPEQKRRIPAFANKMEKILYLSGEGMTPSEIMDETGFSRSYVYDVVRGNGRLREEKERTGT